jgi:hypothetical protein
MASIAEHMKEIEESIIPDLRQRLEVLRSGRTRTGASVAGKPFFDTTEEIIRWNERLLAEYEAVLAAFRKGELL